MQESLDEPIFTAADLLAHRRAVGAISRVPPPEAAILCFHSGALKEAIRKRRVQKLAGFFGDAYLIREAAGKLAMIGNFGVGSPGAVVLLEDLAAFGVKRFVAIGTAGGMQNSLQTGDMVACARAIRDEGTSRHYLEPAKLVEATLDLYMLLLDGLASRGFQLQVGTTWTTDAPYRELRKDVVRFQQEGVKTVEMEAAALFAAGKALGVKVGAAFVVGDTLSGLRWQMVEDAEKVNLGLQALIEVTIQALNKG